MFSECENLIRRMLVLEPSKRFSIEQIKNHHWMQIGEGRPKSTPPSPLIGYNAKVGEFNEQILRLMQSLGINQQKTMEVCQHLHPKVFEILKRQSRLQQTTNLATPIQIFEKNKV